MSSRKCPSNPPSLRDVVKGVGLLLSLCGAWLYLTGWLYAYHYFYHFGIPLLMADIPTEHYFIYGYKVLMNFRVGSVVIVLLTVVIVGGWQWVGVWIDKFAVPVVLIFTLSVFWGGGQWSAVTADEFYKEVRDNDFRVFHRVEIRLTDGGSWAMDKGLAPDDLVKGCYRLVIYSKDRLFLIRPFKALKSANIYVPTVILPWREVALLRIYNEEAASCA